jgi:subtilisin family serine protease
MSFALNDQSDKLQSAIDMAHGHGIVLVCSTADEGENRTRAWPASYDSTLAVAACNDAGEKLVSSTTEARYYFRGENVLYEPGISNGVYGGGRGGGGGGDGGRGGGISSSAEKISGSSVATAIAAGVASLCLACCEIDGVPVSSQNRWRKVVELFDRAKEGKYVRPWMLFGEARRGDNEPMFLGG